MSLFLKVFLFLSCQLYSQGAISHPLPSPVNPTELLHFYIFFMTFRGPDKFSVQLGIYPECRTFRPQTFRPRTLRPGHFGHGRFGQGKCQRWTFRPNHKFWVGWGVCMHKCVMHFLGNNKLNNLIYYT